MARTKKPSRGLRKTLQFRCAEAMFDAVDRACDQLAGERPGQPIERADAIRALVAEALIARGLKI